MIIDVIFLCLSEHDIAFISHLNDETYDLVIGACELFNLMNV